MIYDAKDKNKQKYKKQVTVLAMKLANLFPGPHKN